MTWITYRKVLETNKYIDTEWLEIPLPPITQNSRFPFLINSDGSPCTQANLYLLEDAIHMGRSDQTVRTYAESLSSFFTCLEQEEIDWKHITRYDLLAYREAMRTPTEASEGLAPSTINLRLTVIDNFYRWASDKHLVTNHKDAATSSNSKSSRFTARTNTFNQLLKTPRVKTFNGLVTAPSSIDALEFISTLPEPYDLMAKWQLLTGLRASGIRNLSIETLQSAIPCNNSSVKIHIREKPNKPRYIYAPNFLISETMMYIRGIRKARQKISLKTAYNNLGEEVIFINEKANIISKSSYCNVFYNASIENGTKIRSHMLRASFATNMLAVLKRLENEGLNINALFVVRDLLGHAWMSTTEKYLKNIEVEIAMDALYENTKDAYFIELALSLNKRMIAK